MRITIISDTHGYVDERVAAFVEQCELCLHAGDIGNGSVINRLSQKKNKIIAVLGNNDTAAKWPADQLGELKHLSHEMHVDLPGGRVSVVHGHKVNPVALRHTKLRRLYPDSRAIVYGHSHRLVIDQTESPWVINPGAAGRARTNGGPSYVVLYIKGNNWRVESVRLQALFESRRK